MRPSWQTTVAGILTADGLALVGLHEGGAIELPKWLIIAAYVLAAIGAGWTGQAARDNKVTSEEAGAGWRRTPSLLLAMLLPTLLLGGCVVASANPETGELSYMRLGDQSLNGITYTKLDDGSMEFTLESQQAEGAALAEAIKIIGNLLPARGDF